MSSNFRNNSGVFHFSPGRFYPAGFSLVVPLIPDETRCAYKLNSTMNSVALTTGLTAPFSLTRSTMP